MSNLAPFLLLVLILFWIFILLYLKKIIPQCFFIETRISNVNTSWLLSFLDLFHNWFFLFHHSIFNYFFWIDLCVFFAFFSIGLFKSYSHDYDVDELTGVVFYNFLLFFFTKKSVSFLNIFLIKNFASSRFLTCLLHD
jgi:hypothetical protein